MTGALTLLTAPAILALVNLAKSLGIDGRWSALLAVLLGVGIALLETYGPNQLTQTVAAGMIVGLGASGLYDATSGQAATCEPARRALEEAPDGAQ